MTFARARHIEFLVCVNNPLVLTEGVKFGQSEGIPDSGIPERLPLRKFHRRSLVLSPSLPLFFPALSLALVFARAPLSERLEQAIAIYIMVAVKCSEKSVTSSSGDQNLTQSRSEEKKGVQKYT